MSDKDKVVSIFSVEKKIVEEEEKEEEEILSMEEVALKNKRNKERLEKERKKANKGVIRSYRLKH